MWHIFKIHLIHDDLIIAARTMSEHIAGIHEVMEAISNAGLTLNLEKCKFGSKENKFWGMILSVDRMRPDPDKIDNSISSQLLLTRMNSLVFYVRCSQTRTPY